MPLSELPYHFSIILNITDSVEKKITTLIMVGTETKCRYYK